jgi:hypothetical protein
MKIVWKNLSLAMILAIFVTSILGLISSVTYAIIAIPDSPPGKISYTVVTIKDGFFIALSLTGIIIVGLTCVLILTLVFYFLISFLKKHQKEV